MAEFPKSFRQFTGEHAAVASAYKALGEACAKAGPLDERTRELVKLGIAVGGLQRRAPRANQIVLV